ncbi:glycerate kinase [Brevibacillus invocatus]|uniref:glycerate kinase n=1 Tax=Brevibacillus invocatus TaxID=173959 RepID=UPI00203FE138|nr:glycerate kinase [Brevibacillus invocatus]MCM3080212.1 glycerate kinase [Brevibacillus invocatus]MCM3430342.1 glycerate kinase [Brevibacillus invocatus]
MKIVVAPDSFKGSISARDLCAAVCRGIHAADPKIDVIELPLADGGEGTVDNMVYSTQGETRLVQVNDPLGRPIRAAYGILGDHATVIIEMAQASGLPLLKPDERNPLITSSFGTGELVLHALNAGYRKFIIGLGGSATNDGGAGMLKALGAAFYDQDGVLLPKGGASLEKLSYIDLSGLDKRLQESTFTIASDVNNPLCGANGASTVFGPQKGATPEMVQRLDMALSRFADVVEKQLGIDVRHLPGSGAAGGMGAALLAFLHAEFKSGIELVMDAIHFEQKIQAADLIITGEGKLDEQTMAGKVIAGVCKKAKPYQIPTIAICGGMELTSDQMDEIGLLAGFSIVPKPCSLEQAMEQAEGWAQERVEQIIRFMKRFA